MSYFISFVLHFVTITGKSCKRFRSVRNIAVDPSTCQMEAFSTPDWTFDCVKKCDQNQEVRYCSLPKKSGKNEFSPSESYSKGSRSVVVIRNLYGDIYMIYFIRR